MNSVLRLITDVPIDSPGESEIDFLNNRSIPEFSLHIDEPGAYRYITAASHFFPLIYSFSEAGLTSSPYISGAVMFGRARFQTGVLIAPSSEHKFGTTDVERTKEYINLIW
jgi:hypothetical protein